MSPDFLVIPYQVIADSRLRPTDRLLYGVIYWLVKLKDGHCYASNSHFSNILQITPRAVRNGLMRLESCGYVRRVFDRHQPSRTKRDEIVPLVAFGRKGGTNVPRGVGTNGPQSNKSPKKNMEEMRKELKGRLSMDRA